MIRSANDPSVSPLPNISAKYDEERFYALLRHSTNIKTSFMHKTLLKFGALSKIVLYIILNNEYIAHGYDMVICTLQSRTKYNETLMSIWHPIWNGTVFRRI